MVNLYLNEKTFNQEQFDIFKEALQDTVINGLDCDMYLNEEEEPFERTILMEGYWDIDDEGETTPHFWYNKKELDERGIKYE